ncbi:MAG: glycosyltransferase [Syntrophobacteraceae bacterium]
MTTPPGMSILIPLYNEEKTLIASLRKLLFFLHDAKLDAEIILGSNGSTDATAEIGRMIAKTWPERIKFFHIEKRGMVGEVFKLSARMASSPFLISLDVDLSVGLEFIPKALELLQTNHIVVGSKQSGAQSRSPVRLFGSNLYIFFVQVLLGLPFDDYSIGAKAYRLETARQLMPGISGDTNYVLDLLCRAQRGGFKTAVIPIACSDWRRSRFRLFREALVRFLYLFRVWFRVLKQGPQEREGFP